MSETGIVNIRGKEYRTVALRVSEFRDQFTIKDGWGIRTHMQECTADSVLVKAEIVEPSGKIVATGHAHETWEGQINRTSAVENCETSAIGRALAAAGFAGSEFASANEVERAVHQQKLGKDNRPAKAPPAKPGRATTRKITESTDLASWERSDASQYVAGCNSSADLLTFFNRVCCCHEWAANLSDWEWACKITADAYRALLHADPSQENVELVRRLKEEKSKLDNFTNDPFANPQEAEV